MKKITRFFALRGGLLILFQFLLENPAWRLGKSGPPETMIYVGVLFALGSNMAIGSLLLRMRQHWLVIFSAIMIILTEIALPSTPDVFGFPFLQSLFMVPGYAPLINGGLWVLYPILPWLGVTGLGMAFGRWLKTDSDQAWRLTGWIGIAALSAFVILRVTGGYGNIRPVAGSSWIDFLNMVKYPPSLAFLCFTLGVNFLLLRLFVWLERTNLQTLRPLAVYGRVPLFFYVLHLYLYALLGQWLSPNGMPIVKMYPYWLLGLAILYPLCIWFSKFKNDRPVESVWRLL